ncbi:MAG: hypothetical protein HS128_04585 [Ideonella sp.]|nr:hypothetical protein [Ideonella sp.]MCC7455474.1 hypothetical protein [Nitrospira sp.]
MSRHSRDPKFSPLLWLVPVPFVLAAFVPLTIDHPPPARVEQLASSRGSDDSAGSGTLDRVGAEPRRAASSPPTAAPRRIRPEPAR